MGGAVSRDIDWQRVPAGARGWPFRAPYAEARQVAALSCSTSGTAHAQPGTGVCVCARVCARMCVRGACVHKWGVGGGEGARAVPGLGPCVRGAARGLRAGSRQQGRACGGAAHTSCCGVVAVKGGRGQGHARLQRQAQRAADADAVAVARHDRGRAVGRGAVGGKGAAGHTAGGRGAVQRDGAGRAPRDVAREIRPWEVARAGARRGVERWVVI